MVGAFQASSTRIEIRFPAPQIWDLEPGQGILHCDGDLAREVGGGVRLPHQHSVEYSVPENF